MKKLVDLYKSHAGKVSDKWSLYLREYDRLFAPYQEQSISMLEIGVQNGGSLEIWAKYFPNAKKFIGCDINLSCAKLTYEDLRISIIVGDATTVETQRKVLQQSSSFDLIIEDGSHTSGDIIKAFARYFPVLRDGGIFVAEDLHCSYWQGFEGGINYPYSSMNFFKTLADIVNHEHWGVEKQRNEIISGFLDKYDVDISENDLSNINSVEFLNSICVIKKYTKEVNLLGPRTIAGKYEAVISGHHVISGTTIETPSQISNKWNNFARSPLEAYCNLLDENLFLKEKSNKLADEIFELKKNVEELHGSRSWRITSPLRYFSKLISRGMSIL